MAGETLRVVIGAAAGTEIPIGDEFTLGRTETAEGNLGGDPELSRRHATIRRRPDGGLEIEDLNSTNGTHVNGVRITASHPLSAGDTIRVGQTTINVHAEAPATGPDAGATIIGAAPQMPSGGPEATPPPPPPPPPVEPPPPPPPVEPPPPPPPPPPPVEPPPPPPPPPAPEPPADFPPPPPPPPPPAAEPPGWGEPPAPEPPAAPEPPTFGEPPAVPEPPTFGEPPPPPEPPSYEEPPPPPPEPPSYEEPPPPPPEPPAFGEPPASEPPLFGEPEPEDEGKGPSVPEPGAPLSGDPLEPASPDPTPAPPFEPHGDPLHDDATHTDQPAPAFHDDDATRFDAPAMPPGTPPTEAYPPAAPQYEQPQYEQPQQGYDPYAQQQQAYPEQYQQQAPAAAPAEGLALKRPLARIIILAFITFGIYAYFVLWKIREELNRETGKNEQPIMLLVPIYNIIVLYNMWQDLSYARQRIGQTALSTGEIILALFIWPYGVYLMNQYWDVRTGGQATDAPIGSTERLVIIIGIGAFLVCCIGCVGIQIAANA